MARSAFEIDIFIDAPPTRVKDFLKTLNNHTRIHPLIINIQHTRTTHSPDGTAIDHYTIQDRMKQGPFMLTFSYRVEMSVNANDEIVYDAHQFPRIFLHNVTRCLPEGTGTRLKEHVEITAPGLLIKTVHTQAQASHQEMFTRLKDVLT
ncbi:MAG: SRPBCC family protein [Ktedonobacteraceae bacterium]|nr:SRPBCC family protein [Ktedonobacteraceae bacterium]